MKEINMNWKKSIIYWELRKKGEHLGFAWNQRELQWALGAANI